MGAILAPSSMVDFVDVCILRLPVVAMLESGQTSTLETAYFAF
jgi:hypothetical protein